MTFFRARFGGDVGVGSEIWRCDLMIRSATSDIDDITTAVTAGLTLAWTGGTGVPTSLDGLYSAGTTLAFLEVNQLVPGTGRNAAQRVGSIALPGVAVDDPLPPQCAIVVSHRTTVPTRAGRGRIYLPATSLATAVAGELDSAIPAVIANCMVHAYRAINAGGNAVVVYHRSTDTADDIVSIDVGSVFDTQRRRRNSLSETRASIAI